MINKQRPYELLISYVQAHPNRGLVMTHSDIANEIGIPYISKGQNSRYLSHVSKANKILTSLNLRLESIRGTGYRIMDFNQYAKDAAKNLITSKKYADKAVFIQDSCITTNLTPAEIIEYKKVKDAANYISQNTDTILKGKGIITGAKKTKKKNNQKKNTP
jgi:hypothetical protein